MVINSDGHGIDNIGIISQLKVLENAAESLRQLEQ
jgi:hypothetical protein